MKGPTTEKKEVCDGCEAYEIVPGGCEIHAKCNEEDRFIASAPWGGRSMFATPKWCPFLKSK